MREYFFYIVLMLFIVINIYTAWKVGEHLFFIKKRLILKLFLLISGFSYIIGRVLISSGKTGVLFDGITFYGGLYLAFLNYIFFLFLITDIYYIIKEKIKKSSVKHKKIVYRTEIGVAILIVVLSFLNTLFPVVKKYSIATEKGSLKNQKIVLISDIHLSNNSIKLYWEKTVEKINSLNPDIIVVAGDIVDRDIKTVDTKLYSTILKKLKSKYGVFAITGNHEHYGNLEENIRFIESCGMKVLKDRLIEVNGIIIVGRDDRHNFKRKEVKDILNGKGGDKFLIIADHSPLSFGESRKIGADIQVSGHTHNGQFFPWNIITNYIFELDAGIMKKGESALIVSSGIGGWGPPIRNFSRPEIVEIDIIKK